MDLKINSNIDFRARLLTTGNERKDIKHNWYKISDRFEKLTKDYPEDTFIIRDIGDQLNFGIPQKGDSLEVYNALGDYDDCSFIKEPLRGSLMNLKEENIAKALASLFKMQKHSDEFAGNVRKFVNDNQKFLDDESVSEEFYYACDSAVTNYVAQTTEGMTPAVLHNNTKNIYIHTDYCSE